MSKGISINPLDLTGNCVPSTLPVSDAAFCICGFHMIHCLITYLFINPLKPSGSYMSQLS
jgi:hypothetical protein